MCWIRTSRERGRQLGRISGAADASEARARMIMDFSGKHVIVTGGTGALGLLW
jgi:FlaA1/EpsC-like NDP-sugar epimerase